MIRIILISLMLTVHAYSQVRDIAKSSVDFAVRTSSDTVRNSWPTLLTVRWTGSYYPDTLVIRYISFSGVSSVLPLYDPMLDKVDTLLIRRAPVQAVYLWSRKTHRVFVQRKTGALKTGSSVQLVFE